METNQAIKGILEKCVRCGKCRSTCPSLRATREGRLNWEIYSPRGRMKLAKGLREGKLGASEKLQDSIFTCFVCNQCVVTCPSMASVTDVILETRRNLVQGGTAPGSILQMHETIEDSKNIFGMDQDERVELWSMEIDDLVEEHVGKQAKILYFTGCQASFKGALANIPVKTVQILDALGEDFTLLGEEEECCGNPMELTGGSPGLIEELARHNVDAIEGLGVSRVLFTCPGCYRMFKNRYPEIIGRAPRFTCSMISEYLLELLQEGEIKFNKVDSLGKLVYHDPCELGRHQGIYEIPRNVLDAVPGIDRLEFRNNRENTICCGMGGGVATASQEVPGFQARNKSKDIEEVDADVVVTHCPACFQGISDAASRVSGKNVKVVDLVEIVALALGIE